jgi:hypothetical protein
VTTPVEAMDKLDVLATELDMRSRELADVERKLEPTELAYQAFVDEFEVGLWTKYEDSEYKTKLPPAPMRLKLAHKAMDPELLGRYVGLVNSRKRLEKRISALKAAVDAQRSILSALKVELEATGAGMRRAA